MDAITRHEAPAWAVKPSLLLGVTLLLGGLLAAADLPVLGTDARQRIERAIPVKSTVQPAKARRLLIFTRNQEY